jgi:phage terminase small subunit
VNTRRTNARRLHFVEAYLADPELNATRAYRVVYPRSSQAAAISGSWRSRCEFRRAAAIAAAMRERAKETKVSAGRVLLELSRLAFADHRKLYHADGSLKGPHELDDDTAATVSTSEVEEHRDGRRVVIRTRKVRQWDKREALNLLGKHLGLFADRLRVEGSVQMPAPAPAPPLDLAGLTVDQLRQFRQLLDAATPAAAPPSPSPESTR